jgi:hypothetical protein
MSDLLISKPYSVGGSFNNTTKVQWARHSGRGKIGLPQRQCKHKYLARRSVRKEAVPRESWEALFKSQGMKNPISRIRMLDGFNEGWIDFERGEVGSQKGSVALETVLKALITRGH